MIKFDHDFIGREALEKIASKPHRIKVTLELNDADVQKAIASQYGKDGDRAKFIEFPSAVYSMYPQDKVLSTDGKSVGVSTWMGYSSNERKQLTLAYLDPEFAKPGTEVNFVWGEENGGSKKPAVERHKQAQIRAIVCPVPYVASVRAVYAEGSWREKGKAD
jgi:syringate O-demethylase